MQFLILTYGTEHGEVIVKIHNPAFPLTPESIRSEARKLIGTYRTKRKGIPLKTFHRAKFVDIQKSQIRLRKS